jgi:flagellar hook-basal body complex protein FliE
VIVPAVAEIAASAVASILSPEAFGGAANANANPAAAAASSASSAGSVSFGGMVTSGLEQVNQSLLGSQQDLQNLAVGNVQNLHEVMIRLEESRINFQLMMQIRSRMLESYQDVMRMQV